MNNLSSINIVEAQARLRAFSGNIGIEHPQDCFAPSSGTPSADLRTFCGREGLSLDWVCHGTGKRRAALRDLPDGAVFVIRAVDLLSDDQQRAFIAKLQELVKLPPGRVQNAGAAQLGAMLQG